MIASGIRCWHESVVLQEGGIVQMRWIDEICNNEDSCQRIQYFVGHAFEITSGLLKFCSLFHEYLCKILLAQA